MSTVTVLYKKLGGFLATIALVGIMLLLNSSLGSIPPLGKIIDPYSGVMANAEAVTADYSNVIVLPNVKQDITIWLDRRLVPHIHAQDDYDLYFAQGYLHAYFRLWQMDMQARAAAGKLSEIMGEKTLDYDRKQRRKGMIYAAEKTLEAINESKETKLMVDAYTQGINSYIASLSFATYPLEYKLLNAQPEAWTNLKTALMLKLLADDLTGTTNDIAMSYLRETLSPEEFSALYPERIANSATVIPKGTLFEKPSLPTLSPPHDCAFPHFTKNNFTEIIEDGKGSNNWVVSAKKTKNKAAILCNDPHLDLSLPSIWYEIQLQTPNHNVYGVSLPGAPGVVIGFNDSISWGFTNNYRDVKDYYLIKESDKTTGSYIINNTTLKYTYRPEIIAIKGKKVFIDTVAYTVYGPVQYDKNYPAPGGLKKPLAMCWMAHRKTNELLAIYKMNRANNYDAFTQGIAHFICPAQNMIYSDKSGNIALWAQGQFINKWKNQGRYIMNGADSNSMWGANIPFSENPHAKNPEQGYLASANQTVTDETYPYWYNGNFIEFRAWQINNRLSNMNDITVKDMFELQNDNYSILAEKVTPLLLKYKADKTDKFYQLLSTWNYKLEPESKAASLFQIWWHFMYQYTWSTLNEVPELLYPSQERTMQLLLEADQLSGKVPHSYDLKTIINTSLSRAKDSLLKAESMGMSWYKVKNTSIRHLTKLPAFSYSNLKIGGWGNTINATKSTHGPSWKMVVEMTNKINAHGIYPGGQSGNLGSKYYGQFINDWANGKYYQLKFLPNTSAQDDTSIRFTIKMKHR